MHDLSELSTTIIPVAAATAAAAAVVVAEAAFFISVMSREAPELCKSDVLSSPHGRPTAWQERGHLFSFYPPLLRRKAKRTSVRFSGRGQDS